MPRKTMVLFAVAGLLALAFAVPRPDLAARAGGLDARLRARDSLRMLHARHRGTTLPTGIDVNRITQQECHGSIRGPLLEDDSVGPFGDEFEVAPDHPDYEMNYPVVAFDSTNDQYLVVWSDPTDSKIYGARVEADGTLLDEAGFAIAGATDRQEFPSVAFDGTSFLVVWQDNRDHDDYYDIYGARVSTGGVPEGDFPIYAEGEEEEKYTQELPSVAFDGTNYLVVWQDLKDGDWDIYGQRVSTSDALVGDPIQITNEEDDQIHPRVAYDGTNYLVVWQDESNDAAGDIYGARVTTTGLVYGLADPISEATYGQTAPAVAFDGTDFLVVWEDGRNSTTNASFTSDIYGARVTTAGGVRDMGENAIAFTEEEYDVYPAVAFDGTDHLVVWSSFDSFHIYGRTLSLAGTLGDVWDFSPAHDDNDYPAVACGPVQGKTMVANQAYDVDYDNYRIWARAGSREFAEYPDAATVSIERPVASFLLEDDEGHHCWPIPPMAQLTNNGDEPRSFEATFTISNQADEEVYSETKTVLGLRPDTPRSEVFPPFDLATEGSNLYMAKCTTMLADDDDQTNDSMSAVFQGCDFINFFDLEDGGLTPTPDTCWTRGIPASPPWTVPPPMDDSAWGERLNGQQNNNENSYLTSPNYEAFQAAPSIAFQHCFSTESLADGGNLEYKYGTGSWNAATPSAGFPYNGTVAALGGAGWSGWLSGHSGWKQSVFTFSNVTDGDSFRVRFHYRSGASTPSRGWLIDELAGIGCDLYVGKMGAAGFIDTLNVCPNPVCGTGQISYTLRKAGNVSVKLYDASGRLTARVPTGESKNGKNTATFDATRLPCGVYFVKVEGASNFKTTKLIIE